MRTEKIGGQCLTGKVKKSEAAFEMIVPEAAPRELRPSHSCFPGD